MAKFEGRWCNAVPLSVSTYILNYVLLGYHICEEVTLTVAVVGI